MNIKSAKYVSYKGRNVSISCTIDDDFKSVPIDPNNRHYQAIQEWVAKGNKIEEAD
tara:strand:- start:39 stop:206 length:168 start_codon:yes stop_codon:yes gene_type:complete